MLLRGFGLTIPYIENEHKIKQIAKDNNIDYKEAIKYDFSYNFKEKRSLFCFQTRGICALYERCFEKLRNVECNRILIECVDYKSREGIKLFDGAYKFEKIASVDNFFKLSNNDKRKWTLETLKEGIDEVINIKGWDKTIFDEAYNKVKELNYVNNWVYGKKVKSPYNSLSAEVFCEHDIDNFNINVFVFNIKTKVIIHKEKIYSLKPDELIFRNYLGRIEWISENELTYLYERYENGIIEIKKNFKLNNKSFDNL